MSELFFYLSIFLVSILATIVVVIKVSKPLKYKFQRDSEEDMIDFDMIMLFLESDDTSYDELEKATGMFFEHYDRLKYTSAQKKSFIYALSKHPSANSRIIIYNLNKLKALNPKIESELEVSSNLGLNKR